MRALFLVLLLANLLFLAWTRWVVTPGPGVAGRAAVEAGPLRPIRLQREAGAAGEQPAGPTDAAAAASCVSLGPYLEQAQADAASASLRRLGFSARLRAATDEVRVGHWVHVAELATPADVAQALATLRAAGFDDADVVADEAAGEVVSIGVFADAGHAAAAAEGVARAGYSAQTRDRVRTLDVFWLDVDRQANGGLPELEDAGTTPEGGLPLELRVCPSAPLDDAPAAARPGLSRQFGGVRYDPSPTAPSVPA